MTNWMAYPVLIVLEEGRNIDACFRNKFKSNLDLLGDRDDCPTHSSICRLEQHFSSEVHRLRVVCRKNNRLGPLEPMLDSFQIQRVRIRCPYRNLLGPVPHAEG